MTKYFIYTLISPVLFPDIHFFFLLLKIKICSQGKQQPCLVKCYVVILLIRIIISTLHTMLYSCDQQHFKFFV